MLLYGCSLNKTPRENSLGAIYFSVTNADSVSTTTPVLTLKTINGSFSGCQGVGAISGNVTINFANGAMSSTTPTEMYVSPNDTTCVFTITSLEFYYQAVAYSSTFIVNTYSLTNYYAVSYPSPSYPYGSLNSSDVSSNTPTTVKVASRFNTYWDGSSQFLPAFQIVYGQNSSNVLSVINSNIATGPLSVSSTSNGGSSDVTTPSYCLGSTTTTCDSSNTSSFTVSYDASYNILTEFLSVTLLAGSQSAEKYALISQATNLATNCGTITNLSSTTGCTYTVIDTAFNAATQTTLSSCNTVNANAGCKFSLSYNYLTGTGTEFLGYTFGTPIPSHTSQSAIKYLIFQHRDSTLGNTSYQLIMLNGGY